MREEAEQKDIELSKVLLDKELLTQKNMEREEQIRSHEEAVHFELDLLHQEIDKLTKEREAFQRNL